jgi:hypothetical protein
MLRAIHPISYHEKFVASGVYQTYLEGKLQDEVERWSIHELPDGAELIRVDRGDAQSEGFMLVEVLRSANGHIQRCDIHRIQQSFKQKLNFIFFESYAQISNISGDSNPHIYEVELPIRTLILVPGYVNRRELISAEESETAYFCASIPFSEVNCWLDVRKTRKDDALKTVGGKQFTTKTYLFEAKNRSRTSVSSLSRASFDQHNILLEWKDDQAVSALLTQYARRPEPKTS